MVRAEPWNVRQEYESRPSLMALLGLIVGLTAVSHPANLLALLALTWLRSLPGRVWCALFFAIGLLMAPVPRTPINGRQFIIDSGMVSGWVRRDGHAQTCLVDIGRGTFSMRLEDGPWLDQGDSIEVRGVAHPLSASEDRTLALLTAGTLDCRKGDVTIEGHRGLIQSASESLRSSFEETVHADVPSEAADVISGSIMGVDDIRTSLVRRLRSAGAISLVSVSGLQVLLVASLLLSALRRLPITRLTQLIVLTGLLAIYLSAVGFHPGAVRSSLALLIVLFAYSLRRDPDVLSALAVGAILELLVRPAWTYDFGFQMSFVIVTMMALWIPPRRASPQTSIKSRFWFTLRALTAMFLAAAPLVAYQSGQVSLQTPIAGALILPSVPPIIVFGIGSWIASFASSLLGSICFQHLVAPFAGWVLYVTDQANKVDFLTVNVPAFSAYFLAPIYFFMALGGRLHSAALSGLHRRGSSIQK